MFVFKNKYRHTGKVGPGTRDFVSELGPWTRDLFLWNPGQGTHYARPGTGKWDPKPGTLDPSCGTRALDEKYILQTAKKNFNFNFNF